MSDAISSLEEGERLVAGGQIDDGLRMLETASERIHAGMPYADLFERVRQASRRAAAAERGRYAAEAATLIGLTERHELSVDRFATGVGRAKERPTSAALVQNVMAYLDVLRNPPASR